MSGMEGCLEDERNRKAAVGLRTRISLCGDDLLIGAVPVWVSVICLCRKRGGRMRRVSSGAGISENSRIRMRALSGEVHSGHSATEEESEHGGSSSSPRQNSSHPGTSLDDPSAVTAFKCPKTKKVVFNNWSGDSSELNGAKGESGDLSGGSNAMPLSLSVPVCYMRNPNPRSPTRPFRTAHLR